MTAPGIDSCSLVPLFVEACFQETSLGGATAFLWLRTDLRLSLVTNWHVASGRHNQTGKCSHRLGGIPDHLRVHVPQPDRALPPLIVCVPTIGENGHPLWTEHPAHGREVDVVSLEFNLPRPDEVSVMPMNAIPDVKIKQRVGMSLFILGFPFGRTGIGMPVWKQGSFASEPYFTPHIERHLIVDTASRPGMSGSPVIQRVHGAVAFEGDDHGRMAGGDGACRFVGVYSGRFHTDDPGDAQLGRVWPKRLVEEVVDHAWRTRAGTLL